MFSRFLLAPEVRLERTTLRLTAACSANWAIQEYSSLFYTRKITALPLSSHVSSFRQLSTLPGSHPPSTIDVKELNFCVRHGNRWFLLAIVTGFSLSLKVCTLKTKQCFLLWSFEYLLFPLSLLLALSFLLDVAIHLRKLTLTLWSSPRTISTA